MNKMIVVILMAIMSTTALTSVLAQEEFPGGTIGGRVHICGTDTGITSATVKVKSDEYSETNTVGSWGNWHAYNLPSGKYEIIVKVSSKYKGNRKGSATIEAGETKDGNNFCFRLKDGESEDAEDEIEIHIDLGSCTLAGLPANHYIYFGSHQVGSTLGGTNANVTMMQGVQPITAVSMSDNPGGVIEVKQDHILYLLNTDTCEITPVAGVGGESDDDTGAIDLYEGCAADIGAIGVLVYAKLEMGVSNIYKVYVFGDGPGDPIFATQGEDPYVDPLACKIAFVRDGDLYVTELGSESIPYSYTTVKEESCPVWRASDNANVNWDIFFLKAVSGSSNINQINFWLNKNTEKTVTMGGCPIAISENIIAYQNALEEIVTAPLAPNLGQSSQGRIITEGIPLQFTESGMKLFYYDLQGNILLYDVATEDDDFIIQGNQIAMDQEEFAFVATPEGLCLVEDIYAEMPICTKGIDPIGTDPSYRSVNSNFNADTARENLWIE